MLLKLPAKAILGIGLCIIFLHNLSSFLPPGNSLARKIAMMLVAPGAIPFGNGRLFIMGYPPVPWLGFMLTGFAAGRLFLLPLTKRKPLFLQIGLGALVLFLIVRSVNIYGDTFRWLQQKNTWFTVLSFINVTKYPPSLVFCLLTLGVMFLLLWLVEGRQNRLTAIATVYGKVPLFYFLIHWYILHPLMFLIVFSQGYRYADLVFGVSLGRPKGTSGVNLWYIYLIWVLIVVALYPVCKWYGKYKETHKEKNWLRYL